MTPGQTTDQKAEQLFEKLAVRFRADPAVGEGTGFGSSPGLRVGGKIFAMLVNGHLVVKLSKERVDQLIASGTGARFDPGHGRLMKEWVTIPTRHGRAWTQLVNEALQFVRSAVPSPRKRSSRPR
jgi:hypothetical protein